MPPDPTVRCRTQRNTVHHAMAHDSHHTTPTTPYAPHYTSCAPLHTILQAPHHAATVTHHHPPPTAHLPGQHIAHEDSSEDDVEEWLQRLHYVDKSERASSKRHDGHTLLRTERIQGRETVSWCQEREWPHARTSMNPPVRVHESARSVRSSPGCPHSAVGPDGRDEI